MCENIQICQYCVKLVVLLKQKCNIFKHGRKLKAYMDEELEQSMMLTGCLKSL